MNHRKLTISAACVLALIATTADAKGCRGKAKLRDECREPVTPPPDPTPEPQPEPEPEPQPEPKPEPKDPPKKPKKPKPVKKPTAPKKPAPVARDNGPRVKPATHVTVSVMRPTAVWVDDKHGIFGGGWSRSLKCTSPVGTFPSRAAQVADCKKRAGWK